MITKIDLKKQLKEFYVPPKGKFTFVDVPTMNFLMVDGKGDPNTATEFQEAMQALYGMAYTLKFMSKREMAIDFTIMALEGLWWADDGNYLDFMSRKSTWSWTVMIMQPEHITPAVVEKARDELARKKGPPALPRLRFEPFHEGLSVQIMYLGPYADEGPTILAMHEFIAQNGYALRGKHHEIYLGDPRRTAPEKLRTVVRQPIRKA